MDIESDTDSKPFCDICKKYFMTENRLDQHIDEEHIVSDLFQCNECPAHFKRLSGLEEHMKLHEIIFTLKNRYKIDLKSDNGLDENPKTFSNDLSILDVTVAVEEQISPNKTKTKEEVIKSIPDSETDNDSGLEDHIKTPPPYGSKSIFETSIDLVSNIMNDSINMNEDSKCTQTNILGTKKILPYFDRNTDRPKNYNVEQNNPTRKEIKHSNLFKTRLSKCKVCKKMFIKEESLIIHMKEVHDEKKVDPSLNSNVKVSSSQGNQSNLKNKEKHEASTIKTSDNKSPNPVLQKEVKYKSVDKQAVRSENSSDKKNKMDHTLKKRLPSQGTKLFKCEFFLCEMKFNNRESLVAHGEIHKGNTKLFKRSQSLRSESVNKRRKV